MSPVFGTTVKSLAAISAAEVTMGAEKWVNPFVVLSILAFADALSQTAPAHADYYKYRDSSGIVCITNKLSSVPAKYRAKMKVIREDKPQQANRENQTPPPSAGQPALTESPPSGGGAQSATPTRADSHVGRFAARFPWIKPILVVFGMVAAFFAVARLTSVLPSPQLSRLISIVFFVGLFLFTYKVYADHLVDGYFTIKAKILKMFANANVREAPESLVTAPKPQEDP
ncbi:MAG TPA: hypothetical protein VF799_05495 [Geobacteraceae bacterium]